MKYLSNLESFTYDINDFADISFEEFYKINTMQGPIEEYTKEFLNFQVQLFDYKNQTVEIPPSFDWRSYGQVTSVKNQKACGSCYIFAVFGAVESYIINKTEQIVDLAEQEIVDCGRGYFTAGCNGGSDIGVFSYLDKNGVHYEEDYPYTAQRGVCRRNETNRMELKFNVLSNKQSGDEEALMKQLLLHGPVITSIDHIHESFMRYSRGIYYESECSTTHSTHSVLLIGYGSENGVDYWTVKNSFGEKWGEGGFFRIARNRNNNCMIATESYSII